MTRGRSRKLDALSQDHGLQTLVLFGELELSVLSSLWPSPWPSEGWQEQLEVCVVTGPNNTLGHLLVHLPAPGFPGQWVTGAALLYHPRKSSLSLRTTRHSVHHFLSPWCALGPTRVAEDTGNLFDRNTRATATENMLSRNCDHVASKHRRVLEEATFEWTF